MAIIYNLDYQRISFIYILYITSINYLSCNEDINATFSKIYKKIHYLSDNKELNFMTTNNDYNNICVKNNEISNLLKKNYSSNDEKYLCLYDKSIYVLINENLFEQWFNLTDYLNEPPNQKYYFDLTIYKTEDNIINFIIGFVNNKKIYFLLCKKYSNNEDQFPKLYNISYYSYGKSISCHLLDIVEYNNKLICFYTKLTSSFVLSTSIFDKDNDFNIIKNLTEYEKSEPYINEYNYLSSSIIKNKNHYFISIFTYNLVYCYIYNNINQTFNYLEIINNGLIFGQTYYFEENQNIKILAQGTGKKTSIYSIKNNWKISSNEEQKCKYFHYEDDYNIFYFLSYNNETNQFNLITDLNKTFNCSSVTDEHPEIPYYCNSSNNNIPSTNIISNNISDSIISDTILNLMTDNNIASTYIISSTSLILDYTTHFTTYTNIITEHNENSSYIISSTNLMSTYIPDSVTNTNYKSNIVLPSTIINQIIETTLPNEVIETEKIYIKKENIMNELPSIVQDIEKGKIYQKIGVGENYTILIYPTNSTYLTSVTHVNFTECEKKLRSYYNIPDSEYMTFLQIELEIDDSKSLINQVEYQAYDGNKTLLDLSICDDTNIQVIYSIKNKSLINLDTTNYFQNIGVDIFNINDSFFNDICEPYSESGDDLILEDRIKDIYQNYSLCEQGCTYNKIDLINLTISCQCEVKNNISIVTKTLNVEKASGGSSTNFDVIKCYNLVFSLNGKDKNIGFWIFFLFFLAHFPLLFYYFIKGIKPIKEYIFKEMKKYGYIKEQNKDKKKKEKNNNNIINESKFKKIKKGKRNDKKLTNNLITNGAGPPPKNKKIKENKNKKHVIIKNLKIVDNSSSINYLKEIPKKITSNLNEIQSNNSNNQNKKRNKKTKEIILTSNKFKKNQKLNLREKTEIVPKGNNKNDNIIQIEKNKNLKNYSLINIQLNLSRKHKHIPPDSHIILNNYNYQEAIKYDLRELCVIFYIFALAKQIFFHTFLFRSPLELFPLRLCLFFFIMSSDLALNALFYFNDNISKKYRNAKNLFLFTFSDNITIIILSTFIGFILLTLLSKLSNSINSIKDIFKKEEEKIINDNKYIVNEKRKKRSR